MEKQVSGEEMGGLGTQNSSEFKGKVDLETKCERKVMVVAPTRKVSALSALLSLPLVASRTPTPTPPNNPDVLHVARSSLVGALAPQNTPEVHRCGIKRIVLNYQRSRKEVISNVTRVNSGAKRESGRGSGQVPPGGSKTPKIGEDAPLTVSLPMVANRRPPPPDPSKYVLLSTTIFAAKPLSTQTLTEEIYRPRQQDQGSNNVGTSLFDLFGTGVKRGVGSVSGSGQDGPRDPENPKVGEDDPSTVSLPMVANRRPPSPDPSKYVLLSRPLLTAKSPSTQALAVEAYRRRQQNQELNNVGISLFDLETGVKRGAGSVCGGPRDPRTPKIGESKKGPPAGGNGDIAHKSRSNWIDP